MTLEETLAARINEWRIDGARVGVVTSHPNQFDRGTGSVHVAALQGIAFVGAELAEIDFPEFEAAYQFYADSRQVAMVCAAFVNRELSESVPHIPTAVLARIEGVGNMTAGAYREALVRCRELAVRAQGRSEGIDALVTPTVPTLPPLLRALGNTALYFRITCRATRFSVRSISSTWPQ